MKPGRIGVWAVGLLVVAVTVAWLCERYGAGQLSFIIGMLAGCGYTCAMAPYLLKE
jgi:hypothetical protein